MQFVDPSGKNVLAADKAAAIHLTLRNVGGRAAENCKVELVPSVEDTNLAIMEPAIIPSIGPGDTTNVDIGMKAGADIATGSVRLTLKVLEKNGFDLDPEKVISIPTLAFQPPKDELADYGIEDPNRTGKIQKREIVNVTLRIQNRGYSTSYDTRAVLTFGM